MKKFLFMTVATLVVAVSANAQRGFSKGDWFLGAQSTELKLNHTFGNEAVKSTSFNLQGVGGWFFSNKFAVDALLGFSHSWFGRKDEVDYLSSSGFAFGAGVRYYPISNLFARVGYLGEKVKDVDLKSELKVSVGYDLFISEKVYFEPAVYWAKDLNARSNALGLSVGIGVKF